jgi:hypothetical protein
MSNLPIYEVLAQAFVSEGYDTLFNLMGDGKRRGGTACVVGAGQSTASSTAAASDLPSPIEEQ